MDKQTWHTGSAAESELSKVELTALFVTSSSNQGEVLKQEHVQLSILHLVTTDQQWMTDHSIDLLQSLSRAIRTRAYETYSWKLRSSLLQAWRRIPSIRHSPLLHSWLDVRWEELGKLLSLDLPEEWSTIAITMLLNTPLNIPPQDVVSIVSYHTELFEASLRQLMRKPAAQKTAIRFFITLAEHSYPRKVPLLESMLLAGTISRETMEELLVAARVEPRNVVNLLENHCQQILLEHELPPTMLGFIRQYLVNFDVDYLNAGRTKELLYRLQQRNEKPALRLPSDLQAYVQGWCRISELLEQPAMGKQWLRDVDNSIRNMPLPAPGTQIKLTDMLLPRLVELVSSEMDLCRVMDNLGRVLMGADTGAIAPGLLLLEQMTARVGVMYGREQPPVRLVPYIKVVLEEAHHLPSPEKEAFVHRCLAGLLRSIDVETLNMLKANAVLWPQESQVEWKTFLIRYGLMTIAEAAGESGESGLTTQLSTGTTHALSSPLDTTEHAHYPVAVVNQQPISFEQFRKMYYIKAQYRQYEDHVQRRTVGKYHMHSSAKEFQVQVNKQQLQQEALDELVEDLLIREEIAEMVKQNSLLSLNFDPQRRLSPRFQDFKEFCGSSYTTLLHTYQLNDADVVAALRIFILRELFDLYLQNERKSLHKWLKERRRRAIIVVNIQQKER